MNTASVTNIMPKDKVKEIEKAGQKITKLIEVVRVNIAPIFMAEGQQRKLHTRYLQQRKKRIWEALETIGTTLQAYRATPNLQLMLIEGILRTIVVTRGEVDNILDTSSVSAKAKDLMNIQSRSKDQSGTTIVLEIIRESGIAITGFERFITVTSRKIG